MRIQFQILFFFLGFQLILAQYDFIHSPHTLPFDDAVNWCKARLRNLVKITDSDKNDAVTQYAKNNKVLWFWFNGNDKETENVWVDTDKKLLIYRNFKAGEPGRGRVENCGVVETVSNGQWHDGDCALVSAAMCDHKIDVAEKNELIHSPVTMTFDNAVNWCKARLRNLVKIVDDEKNNLVTEYAKKNNVHWFWFNGNDKQTEAVWVDTDNKLLIYRNWKAGEPGRGLVENCGVVETASKGQWHDGDCALVSTAICDHIIDVPEKIEFIHSPAALPFDNAVSWCKERQRKLVKIYDTEKNTLVTGYAKKNNLQWFWFNGNDKATETVWVDTDNNLLIYRNWKSGEPGRGRLENCGVVEVGSNGQWHDGDCALVSTAVCEY